MASSVLKLFYLLNNPAKVNFETPAMALDDLDPPTLLITSKALAKEILKAEKTHVFNLVNYWKTITRISAERTAPLSTHFGYSPLLQSGTAHREARKSLLPMYKSIEEELPGWLPQATEEFFRTAQSAQTPWRTDEFADCYVRLVFKKILCFALNANESDCPPLPGQLFSFFLRRTQFDRYCTELNALHDWIVSKPPSNQETNGHDLLSITVMGREPMVGALAYGINQRTDRNGDEWTAVSLMEESSPVSELIAREITNDFSINDLQLKKNQIVHISPFLLDLGSEPDEQLNPMPFGHGPHLCLGRGIALKITESFLACLKNSPDKMFKRIDLFRDNVLSAKVQHHD